MKTSVFITPFSSCQLMVNVASSSTCQAQVGYFKASLKHHTVAFIYILILIVCYLKL
jgi:hypothetical protein